MTTNAVRSLLLGLTCTGLLACAAEPMPRTGPETEKRFPPLQVPAGFRATLFACDPLVEYPSAVARGPRPGALFVAADYMTGLGTEIVRRDEIHLIEDTDNDGYADRTTVYAGKFNSIQGLTFHAGTVYAMHAPFLTALKDTDGDGQADWRKDLLSGLGLPPEKNPVRLHCANGLVMGHDGWLYLALGDHGCAVPRPEGDRLVLEGGGILRCRADGSDLHIFATGLRNIYDVALDEELNVFVRDNENDGGDYKIRVCHSFHGADHGYPYLYYERPSEALPPLADLGLGSSAGGVCYLEPAFPVEYQGDLFFCEWGRAVVRYRPQRQGSSFAPLAEHEFASGAADDPYGFKPTDLVVQRDGSLIVVDWADGQRPKRGRGRIYRIAPSTAREKPDEPRRLLARLDSPSYYTRVEAQEALERQGQKGSQAVRQALAGKRLGRRGRLHAIWVLAHVEGQKAVSTLLGLADSDPSVPVRAQAVRALADLTDPVLTNHRLAAGRGDARLAERLAALAPGQDDQVLLEIILAVGRLRWADAPGWLRRALKKNDPALDHAAMQTLRRADNWPAVLRLLDEPDSHPIRAIALRACADRANPVVVDGLLARLGTEKDPTRRRQYADTVCRVYKKPGPWVYWGYRPPPRPANTVSWERTRAIEEALDALLADPDRTVRLAVLERMQREKVPTRLPTLRRWLGEEREEKRVAALLQSVSEHPREKVSQLLREIIANREYHEANRLKAWSLYGAREVPPVELLELARSLEEGPVLAAVFRHLGKQPRVQADALLLGKLKSPVPVVRAAAVEALSDRQVSEAGSLIRPLLDDADPRVRRAAALAMGKFRVRSAIEPLLKLAGIGDLGVREASLESLRLFREPRVVPLAVAALAHRETRLTALGCLSDLGGPEQVQAVVSLARRDPSAEVLSSVVRMLSRWGQDQKRTPAERQELARAVAEVQGAGGVLVRWNLTGPLSADKASSLRERIPAGAWKVVFASGTESRVSARSEEAGSVWLAYTDLHVARPTGVQFLLSGSSPMRVWLNDGPPHTLSVQTGQFEASLRQGGNRVVVEVTSPKKVTFQVRFRQRSSSAERERLARAALTGRGNVKRGRELFLNAEKSQCIKCHRIGDQGERIGPELTGVGKRFSRIHLIESILEPSLTIAPSYETLLIQLKDGRTLSGVKVAETDKTLTLADSEGRKLVLARASIEERQAQALSTMPEGLEKKLSVNEFLDLIAFLVSQKE